MKATALITAAGGSVRFGGDLPKQFCEAAGKPLLVWTIERFIVTSSIGDIFVVAAPGQIEYTRREILAPFNLDQDVDLVPGGSTRQESVLNGLEAIPDKTELVAIHDGARPLVLPADIERVVALAAEHKAAMLVAPMTDTVKQVRDDCVVSTVERSGLVRAQTPQVFDYQLIVDTHRKAAADGIKVTDDSALLELSGITVRFVEGANLNMKVTTQEDMVLVEAMLKGRPHG